MVLTPLTSCGVSLAEDSPSGVLRLDASRMRFSWITVRSNDGRETPSTRQSIHNLLRSKH